MLLDNSNLKKDNLKLYITSGAFILLNSIFIAMEQYWFMLIPVALIIGYIAFTALDLLLLLIVFFTPLAINIEGLDLGLALSVPTEPLIFGLMLLFFLKYFYEGNFPGKIINHPVSIIILLHLIWIAFTAFTSEMPVVSFKFLLSRIWFVISFYFFAILVFRQQKNIFKFIWAYIVPMAGVIIYTIYTHSTYNFSEETGHWVMNPFFKDHTAYGAILAFFIPVLIYFAFKKQFTFRVRSIVWLILILFISATILSYTRAAWISLIGAFLVYLIFILKIKARTILLGTGFSLFIFLTFFDQIINSVEKNRQDSSDNLAEHVESIGNISSDASNLERINRWNSAFRMFLERPFTGWGPGTYMFQYAPFQKSKDLTIISTNAGDGGNAHSEYLGPMAEQGAPGLLIMLALVIGVLVMSVRLYHQTKNKDAKNLILVLMLGLITYFIHGTLNNFLDTDKASVPFWGFIAILVALDLYHREKKELMDSASE